MQFSSAPYYFIRLRSKYSPQHPLLKQFQSCVLHLMWESRIHISTKLQAKLCFQICCFQISRRMKKYSELTCSKHSPVPDLESSCFLPTPKRPGFNPRSCGISGEQSSNETVPPPVLQFPCQFSFHQLLHIYWSSCHRSYTISILRASLNNNLTYLKSNDYLRFV
jgi:hypothetical protein